MTICKVGVETGSFYFRREESSSRSSAADFPWCLFGEWVLWLFLGHHGNGTIFRATDSPWDWVEMESVSLSQMAVPGRGLVRKEGGSCRCPLDPSAQDLGTWALLKCPHPSWSWNSTTWIPSSFVSSPLLSVLLPSSRVHLPTPHPPARSQLHSCRPPAQCPLTTSRVVFHIWSWMLPQLPNLCSFLYVPEHGGCTGPCVIRPHPSLTFLPPLPYRCHRFWANWATF